MLRRAHLARVVAAALAVCVPSAGSASVELLVNSSGQLTGATGLSIGGSLYDVTFAQCSAGPSGFTAACTPYFHTAADAGAAAQALLDQVFVDGSAGMFDSNPSLTLYCSTASACYMAVPYTGAIDSEAAFNGTSSDSVSYVAWYPGPSPVSSPLNVAEFIAVPEPASWAMMLVGFAAIGVALRRRRSPVLGASRA